MCGLGAVGILMFGVVVLLLAGVYGACLWYVFKRYRSRRKTKTRGNF